MATRSGKQNKSSLGFLFGGDDGGSSGHVKHTCRQASAQQNASSLAFMMTDAPDAQSSKRNGVNWTLSNAKRSFATVGGQQTYVHDVTNISDIVGASASTTQKYVYTQRFADKPTFYSPADVDGSAPRPQVPAKPVGFAALGQDRALQNRDIEHCYPESKLFSTPRIVNPLNPVYNLPPCKHALPPPAPARRDPLAIDDIAGTRARKARVDLSKTTHHHDTLDTTDIALSTAGSMSAARKRKSNSRMMETRDITHPPELDVEPFLKNPRGTNPLAPVYRLSAPRGAAAAAMACGVSAEALARELTVGPVAGSAPKPRADERRDRPLLSLRADDIVGARPKHLGVIKQFEYDERNGGSKRIASFYSQ